LALNFEKLIFLTCGIAVFNIFMIFDSTLSVELFDFFPGKGVFYFGLKSGFM